MRTNVVELDTLTGANAPADLLVETSFLCDAMWARRGESSEKAQRSLDALASMARQDHVRLWITPAILQETVFAFMKAEMRREARASLGRALGWSQFKDLDREAFGAAHAVKSAIAEEVRFFVATAGIEESLPRVRLDAQTTGRWIAAYMTWYLRRYPIEPADALHLACARVDGTRTIATNDLELQAVGGFRFLAYRRAL